MIPAERVSEFAGEFETHLTVRAGDPRAIESLREWAESRGFKFTHIELSAGSSASQPMVTREGRGSLSEQLALAQKLTVEIRDAGFSVCRVKIEASPWNQDIPQTEDDAAIHPPEQYFEHHVKLLLDGENIDASLNALVQFATRHSAHLSRNAIRTRDDGRRERFLTQRCRGVGQPVAKLRLQCLKDDLMKHGHQILEAEEEFVVYDSNLALDAGWMEVAGER